ESGENGEWTWPRGLWRVDGVARTLGMPMAQVSSRHLQGGFDMGDEALKSFFEEYARASLDPDPEALAGRYANAFIAAGPTGSAVFNNDEAFRSWLRQVHEFNQQSGMQSLEVVSVRRVPIEDHHALATVECGATFSTTGEELIRFEISYLVQFLGDSPLVLAYVSHDDQEQVMKARGL